MEGYSNRLDRDDLIHLLFDIHVNGLTEEMINNNLYLSVLRDEYSDIVNYALETERRKAAKKWYEEHKDDPDEGGYLLLIEEHS